MMLKFVGNLSRRMAIQRAVRPLAVSSMQTRFLADWKERGKAQEDLWFTQHEAELMEKMINKMKMQTEAVYGERGVTEAREALVEIFKKHGVGLTLELAEELRDWRMTFKASDSK
mmetsp:Transcript_4081/g.6008  ORF Transcript_4081/g.6008 Transcript_4081/m.6008 type:complete len:115 (+) Transcript_4081:93-437(+)